MMMPNGISCHSLTKPCAIWSVIYLEFSPHMHIIIGSKCLGRLAVKDRLDHTEENTMYYLP